MNSSEWRTQYFDDGSFLFSPVSRGYEIDKVMKQAATWVVSRARMKPALYSNPATGSKPALNDFSSSRTDLVHIFGESDQQEQCAFITHEVPDAWNSVGDDEDDVESIVGRVAASMESRNELAYRQQAVAVLSSLKRISEHLTVVVPGEFQERLQALMPEPLLEINEWTNVCQDAERIWNDRSHHVGVNDSNWWVSRVMTKKRTRKTYVATIFEQGVPLTTLAAYTNQRRVLARVVYSLGWEEGSIEKWGGYYLQIHCWAPSLTTAGLLETHERQTTNAFLALLERIPQYHSIDGATRALLVYFHPQLPVLRAITAYILTRREYAEGPFIRRSLSNQRQADDDIYQQFPFCLHVQWLTTKYRIKV